MLCGVLIEAVADAEAAAFGLHLFSEFLDDLAGAAISWLGSVATTVSSRTLN